MLFFKVNDLLLLEKPRCREGDFCGDLSVLLLFMKAQIWNVKSVHVVIFVFCLAFAVNKGTGEDRKRERLKISHILPSNPGNIQ